MAIRIITNNPKFNEYCRKSGQDSEFINGHAKEVLFHSRDLLISNKLNLAADPLGGYLSRPNPYHTVFLKDSTDQEFAAYDILRIERSISQWYRYTNMIEMTDQLDDQYQDLDFSIAFNTLQGLLKNPFYHMH